MDLSTQAEHKVRTFFNELNKDTLDLVDAFYDENALLVDPIGSYQSSQNIKKYYQSMYKNVTEIRFDFDSFLLNIEKNEVVAIWKMYVKSKALNDGKEMLTHGNSHFKFTKEGKVVYHRDYFDTGEFVYDNVPVLNWLHSYIKKKLKSQ